MPFTIDQFIGLFEEYNRAIWPMQALAYLLGIVALFLVFYKRRFSERIVSGVLAFFWVWTGVAYHLMFFTGINPLAWGFGGAFVLQGILLFYEGVIQREISFRFRSDFYSYLGIFFILYAMIIYPVIGELLGRSYPRSPSFGLTPCPAGIFTFGIFLLANDPFPRHLLMIPFLWSAIGFFAAISLGITEDIGLLIAGLSGSLLIIYREQKITAQRLKKARA
jgi:hypothetical protein